MKMKRYEIKSKQFLVLGIIFLIISAILFFVNPNDNLIYLKVQMSRDLLIRLGFVFSLVGAVTLVWKIYRI